MSELNEAQIVSKFKATKKFLENIIDVVALIEENKSVVDALETNKAALEVLREDKAIEQDMLASTRERLTEALADVDNATAGAKKIRQEAEDQAKAALLAANTEAASIAQAAKESAERVQASATTRQMSIKAENKRLEDAQAELIADSKRLSEVMEGQREQIRENDERIKAFNDLKSQL
jgi:hypothetical protein